MPHTLRAKLIVVGDAAVGKSAITQVCHSDGSHFPKTYNMTVGVELCTKTISIPGTHDHVELFIYDCAGKELFTEQVMKHWDHPSLVMVVYDCTNETSYNSCTKWLERVRSQKPGARVPGVLVCNKIDQEQRRMISRKEGQDFAQANSLEYFECSAKETQSVDQPFQFLAKAWVDVYQEKLDIFKSLN